MGQGGEYEIGAKRHGVFVISSVQAWSSWELAMGFRLGHRLQRSGNGQGHNQGI